LTVDAEHRHSARIAATRAAVARLASGLAATEDEILDALRIELWHLSRRLHDQGGEVVRRQSTSEPLLARPMGVRAVTRSGRQAWRVLLRDDAA